MKFLLIIFLIFFLNQCNKPKTVLICGDHVCVNKAEAELFFEENLSIEVQIIDIKKNKKIDLVQLNIKNNDKKNKQINIKRKNETDKDIIVLNNAEIKKIKENIQKKKRNKKIVKFNKNDIYKKKKTKKTIKLNKRDALYEKNVNKIRNEVVDICTIIEKCNIDSISKYLLEQDKKNKFPDITTRE